MRVSPVATPLTSSRYGTRLSVARRVGASILFTMLLIGGIPSTADAHGKLKRSEPAAGAHLGAVPRELRLEFNEVPELAFTTVQLLDASGQPVDLGPVSYAADSTRVIVVVVRGRVTGGAYMVVWQMAGADGHPVRGRYRFVVAPGASGTDAVAMPAPASAPGALAAHDSATMAAEHQDPVAMPTGNGFGAESPVYVLIRWALFAGLLLVIGAVAFRQLVLRFLRSKRPQDAPMLDTASRQAARIGHRAAQAVLAVVVLRLLAQSVAMHGARGALDLGLIGPMLVRTTWGYGWLLQLFAIVVAGVGFHRAWASETSTVDTRRGWAFATAGVLVLAFTPGLSGHAVAAPQAFPLGVVADGLHILGAGGWLGSLTMVLFAGMPVVLALPDDERGARLADLFNAFSPTALMCAGMLATTGVFAAWLHVGSVPGLWRTDYGRILLLKVGVLSVVAATGAYNWLRVKPALQQVHGASRIRRSATVELVVAVVVLLITAVLVATPTAMDAVQ